MPAAPSQATSSCSQTKPALGAPRGVPPEVLTARPFCSGGPLDPPGSAEPRAAPEDCPRGL
eukprot:1069242-Lingulodinium_polyedra.AAC.1